MERLFFAIYFLLLCYIVWLMPVRPQDTLIINLIPFRTIHLFVIALIKGYAPLSVILANVIGNVFLTIPLGFFIARIFGTINLFLLVFIAFYIPTHIESMQLFLHVIGYSSRTVDIDDVILNALGIIIGYYGVMLLQKRQAAKARL